MIDKMQQDRNNSILCVVDLSYWLYYTCYGAISEYMKSCPLEAKVMIKPPEETDQEHLPDLLVSTEFKRILKRFVMRRIETIDWQLKGHFQDQIDIADSIDYIFAMDDYTKNSFRRALYPQYKAQRKLRKSSYDMFKIQQHVLNVIFKELEIDKAHAYHMIKVPGAEADDVIAMTFKEIGPRYMLNVLFASDKDFLQLDNVHQINLFGKEVECKLGKEKVTPKEFMLAKILMGDGSDNIKQVFSKVGAKRALGLVRNKEELKKKLNEDQEAAQRFLLNKKLVCFDEIPSDLKTNIVESVSTELYKEKPLNSATDFRQFMMM